MALSPQHALIYLMITVSAADREMTDRELRRIGTLCRAMPIFQDFDEKALPRVSEACARMLAAKDGLKKVIAAAKAALPKSMGDTAYAMAVEIAAADLFASEEEMRLLEIIGDAFKVPALTRAAIEASARARHRMI